MVIVSWDGIISHTTARVLRPCYFGPDTFNFHQHLLEAVFMFCNMSAALWTWWYAVRTCQHLISSSMLCHGLYRILSTSACWDPIGLWSWVLNSQPSLQGLVSRQKCAIECIIFWCWKQIHPHWVAVLISAFLLLHDQLLTLMNPYRSVLETDF